MFLRKLKKFFRKNCSLPLCLDDDDVSYTSVGWRI
jgi:hypothetical protein